MSNLPRHKFKEDEKVVAVDDHLDFLKAGCEGVVWVFYNTEPPAYEVTFRDSKGIKFDMTTSEYEIRGVTNRVAMNSMCYEAVQWLHSFSDEPVWIYYEVDADRWEQRKVEVFRDGSITFAYESHEAASTRLGLSHVPPFDEIAGDAQFKPQEITHAEFAAIWSNATQKGNRREFPY